MMNRRNYLQSVVSLPLLSTFSLPSDPESEDDSEFPYTIDAMWHRGREDGHIYTDDYSYEYTEYDQWEASTVVFGSLRQVDILPQVTRIDSTRLISVTDNRDGKTRVLLTSNKQDFDVVLSSHNPNFIKFCHYDGKTHYKAFEDLSSIEDTIQEVA